MSCFKLSLSRLTPDKEKIFVLFFGTGTGLGTFTLPLGVFMALTNLPSIFGFFGGWTGGAWMAVISAIILAIFGVRLRVIRSVPSFLTGIWASSLGVYSKGISIGWPGLDLVGGGGL